LASRIPKRVVAILKGEIMPKSMTAVEPEYMTTAEVAELLRSPQETVRYWRHLGKGPRCFKVGRRVLYPVADVRAWLTELETGAGVG
jgi:excisionase family DNA binding protein